MRIAFHLLDLSDKSFKKVYFKRWHGNIPEFSDKKLAKEYWNERQALDDMSRLKKATSKKARTLAIRLEGKNE
ncbi:hypothetical protein IGI37_000077 [Enterococcus sp. AZ194]|uniref:hypothetical protein n=1 Tax=Enterococcus sp. AZ194 TaxID=2774629 RepID=UPI003F21F52A